MQRWKDLADVPAGAGPSVVTIGNFDGVHRGHRTVLTRIVEEARSRGAWAVAITFEPHPLHVLHPDRAPRLITGPEHRLDLLEDAGLDAVLEMEFTRDLASWSPERFVQDVIVGALGASAVVVGHDIRFGRKNAGDLVTMQELGARLGFDVLVLDDVHGDPGHGRDGTTGTDRATGTDSARESRRWSSTWVRELLEDGDVVAAATVLGRPHRVTGTVVHGDHRGRELGYPTANLGGEVEGLVPADGVYAGWLVRPDLAEGSADRRLPAAVSIGTNPTFDGTTRRVEAYALDRDDLDLYGERVAVELVERLRDTLRFESVDALLEQMARDVAECRSLLVRAGAVRGVSPALE